MKPIENILEDICGQLIDSEIILDYSGRNMFGKTCVAVSSPYPITVVELAAIRGLTGAQLDSLGMGSVVYWPKYNKESKI